MNYNILHDGTTMYGMCIVGRVTSDGGQGAEALIDVQRAVGPGCRCRPLLWQHQLHSYKWICQFSMIRIEAAGRY